MIVVEGIAGVGRIGVEIGLQVDPKTVVVKHMAVGKLPQAANTVLVKMIHNPHLAVEHHTWLGAQCRETHYSTDTVSLGTEMRVRIPLTNEPGLCPRGLFCAPLAPSIGVLLPLPVPAAFSASFRALCSANRFFRSAGDSNFGFLGWPPWFAPGPGLPVAARRSASAW